jgi:hypothetical protein
MLPFGRHKTKNPRTHWEMRGFLDSIGLLWIGTWSRRQESNLYLALRRHSFYPLNYGETLDRLHDSQGEIIADSAARNGSVG